MARAKKVYKSQPTKKDPLAPLRGKQATKANMQNLKNIAKAPAKIRKARKKK